MADEAQLTALIEPEVASAGFALVRVRMTGADRATLQVMAEDPATGQMTLDQCAFLSRRLSALLDAADPIAHAYTLEVSSPGIDRPLTRLADFERFRPHAARIELLEPIDHRGAPRRRFQGALDGTEGEAVCLRLDDGERLCLPLAAVKSAKLLLTEALLKASPALDPSGADRIEHEEGTNAAQEQAAAQDGMSAS
jgi:ribosome maturation factor RimP